MGRKLISWYLERVGRFLQGLNRFLEREKRFLDDHNQFSKKKKKMDFEWLILEGK